jgi:hypothetical protein
VKLARHIRHHFHVPLRHNITPFFKEFGDFGSIPRFADENVIYDDHKIDFACFEMN